MSEEYSHGARNVDFHAYNSAQSSLYILLQEVVPNTASFKVQGWEKRVQGAPVILTGSGGIFESGQTSITELLARDDIKIDISEFKHCPDYDAQIDYTILVFVFDTNLTADLEEFQYKTHVSIEYGVAQTAPFTRELLTGTVSVRQGTC